MGLLPGNIPPMGPWAGLTGPTGRELWFCMYWLICSGMAPMFYISLMILTSRSLKRALKTGLEMITR